MQSTDFFTITNPQQVLGRSIVVFMRDGSQFGFKVLAVSGDHIIGHDHEGINLSIDIHDICVARWN